MYNFDADPRPKVKLSDIIVPPNRARRDFSDVMNRKASIEENGLIQPVVLAKSEISGKWLLIAGETRYRAFLLIPEAKGLIPFTECHNTDELSRKTMELVENVERRDLNWQEQVECIRQIDEIKRKIHGVKTQDNPEGWTLKKTAELENIPLSTVQRQVGLAKKLIERPDIKERVKNLPMTAAEQEIKRIEEAERTERLATSGQITLTTELVNESALTFLPKQPDSSIDLFLIDPPFGMEELDSRKGDTWSSTNGKSSTFTGKMKDDDNSTRTEVLKLMGDVLPQMFRTLKPGCHFYIFCDLELSDQLRPLIASSGLEISWPLLVWDKGRSTSIFRGYSYMSCYEAIIFGFKPADQVRRLQSPSSAILRFAPLVAKNKVHIFEKPLDLLCDLIKRSTNHGDLVCDCFAGSASTLDAAKQSGRKAIGCELNKENYLKAQGRLLLSTALPGAK